MGQSRLAIGVMVAVAMVVLLGPWTLEMRNDGDGRWIYSSWMDGGGGGW